MRQKRCLTCGIFYDRMPHEGPGFFDCVSCAEKKGLKKDGVYSTIETWIGGKLRLIPNPDYTGTPIKAAKPRATAKAVKPVKKTIVVKKFKL